MRKAIFALACAAFAHSQLALAQPTYATFSAPGAGTGEAQGTIPSWINNAGTVAGFYVDSAYVCHGFVRATSGGITSFDAPGAADSGGSDLGCIGTVGVWINTTGAIAGFYVPTGQVPYRRGFVRSSSGSIQTFDVSGNTTVAWSINDFGTVAGYYQTLVDTVNHGFLRSAHGTITTFDVPGAGTGLYQGTVPLAVNDTGVVTGYYYDSGSVAHGFVRAADGTITTFDAPGAGFSGTMPSDINSAGTIIGSYVSAASESQVVGFVRATDGTITSFDGFPQPSNITFPYAVNSKGVIVGNNSPGPGLAFERSPNGKTADFAVPGGTGGTYPTQVSGINSTGVITGQYVIGYTSFGFIRTP